MDTIFLLWAIVALIVGLGIFWSMRARRPSPSSRNETHGAARKKRTVRKTR
ncbi:MAG: hypothetical protein ACREX0_00975 [Noviherbaspirillum sp.]